MKNNTVVIASLLVFMMQGSAMAADGAVESPTGTAPDRYVYYPGTEELAKDEIRLFACGYWFACGETFPGSNMLVS